MRQGIAREGDNRDGAIREKWKLKLGRDEALSKRRRWQHSELGPSCFWRRVHPGLTELLAAESLVEFVVDQVVKSRSAK